jgi:DNA-directed RNA polymerase beta subunit
MLSYDKGSNLLTLEKVHNPSLGEHLLLLKDLRESFDKFINEGVYEALESINEIMETEDSHYKKLIFKPTLVEGFGSDDPHIQIKCYPEGCSEAGAIRVIDLPYMDNLGKLHFNKNVKSFVCKLASSDDVSYDLAKQTLSLVLASRMIKITVSGKSKKIEAHGFGRSTISLAALAAFIAYEDGEQIDVWDIIRNPLLIPTLEAVKRKPEEIPVFYAQTRMVDYDTSDKKSGTMLIHNLREEPAYAVTRIRHSINKAVSLDRALGETLSRPVLNYEAGSYVTPAVIQDLKRNKVNCIYVQTVVPDSTSKIAGGMVNKQLTYTVLGKGWTVTKYLADRIPELDKYPTIPTDTPVPHHLLNDFSFKGKYASKEILDFLQGAGEPGVYIGSDATPCYFETEILSNHTLQYGDVYSQAECQTMGVSPHEWFCYLNDNTDSSYRKDRLYADDLLALLSTIGYILLRGKSVFLDRDKDFLKKVETPEIALKRELVYAIRKHVNTYRDSVRQYVKTGDPGKGVIFDALTHSFIKRLNEKKLLDRCDVTNYAAEISQALHVSVDMKEPPEIVRRISTPYYGRLCPFETPEGKRLGLVNTKALGCEIKDGNLLCTVRKVFHNGGTLTISNQIETLSVDQELQYRITDVLELTPGEKEGEYLNTRIKAKVPNPSITGDRQIIAEIMAEDLDYVYSHTESLISPTVSLIPFATTDDAIRVSFGSKMIKQGIYLLNPDKPRVQTSMYRDIFKCSDAYLLVAEKTGTVTAIDIGRITVMYDGDTDETVYKVNEFAANTERVLCMRYRVRENERVVRGQILADSSASQDGVYCPGKNLLVAYMPTGYNYEDAVHTSMEASVEMTSPSAKFVRRKISGSYEVNRDGMYKYYKAGEKITTVTKKQGNFIDAHDVHTNVSGIWYSIDDTGMGGARELHFNLLGYRKLTVGDKVSGRHGNKGVDAKVDSNSSMPMLPNGTPVQILLNPHGLPSRMNAGQIMEAHLGLVATVLGIYINSDSFNGASLQEVQMLMKMTHELANCGNKELCWSIMSKYGMPRELQETVYGNMDQVMDWAGTFDEVGDCRLYNPMTGKWFPHKITIGVSTILKMKQEGESKIHGRGGPLEEEYMMTSAQPTSGGARGGGQAMGGMESWAVQSYGASNVAHDMVTVNSDDEVGRTNKLLDAFGSPVRIPERYAAPRALTNFIYYLEALGLKLEDDEGLLPAVDKYTSQERYIYDVGKMINKGRLDAVNDYETDETEEALFRSLGYDG